MLNGKNVYIVDGCRTPFLKVRGVPGPFKAADLALAAAKPLLARQSFPSSAFDEVILGCVAPTADEANIARIVSLRLECGESTPAWTVARNCASGLQALDSAATNIAVGRSDLVLAGGTEAMSHAPVLFSTEFVRWLGQWTQARTLPAKIKTIGQLRPGYLTPVIGLLRGLTDPVCGLSMGQTTEKIAHRFGITRQQMDEYANTSQHRLAKAADEGLFSNELTAIFDHHGNHYDFDDGVRRDSSLEKLAKLRPVFDKPAGRVTAGNSAQITDGSAMLILANEDAIKKYELTPRARIVDCHWAGVDPTQMGLGPVHAATPLLTRSNLAIDDIDYWEINEAFAGQVLGCLSAWQSPEYCLQELGLQDALGEISTDRLNIHGGGISIGHPVGASGARIVLHSLNTLEQNGWNSSIATLCIGGGQGGAMLIERIPS